MSLWHVTRIGGLKDHRLFGWPMVIKISNSSTIKHLNKEIEIGWITFTMIAGV